MGSPSSASNIYDYILVGGGVCGLALASRLLRLLPPSDTEQVLVPDAGVDPATVDPGHILSSQTSHLARESRHSYQLTVAPNRNLGGRRATVPMEKGLGGSAAINGGAWTNGSRSDFDLWARIVGEPLTWKKVPAERDGADHAGGGGRRREEADVKYLIDGNGKGQDGLTGFAEVWVDGIRQLPGKFQDLTRVEVLTESVVQRVTFEQGDEQSLANGVDWASGEHFVARKEVILSAGVFHSPQILKLSGIGDRAELEKHGIKKDPRISRSREETQGPPSYLHNLETEHPEKGLAIGSPLFTDPTYFGGWSLEVD
ncbi:choline dehydrogenase [Cladophialophora carrionii]|uniref:Choline dehydrogenase n=1 Tax=Cladophialophora carrionii TaxID=86049 RepID=A0A1C1CFM9_9EURO|nr:choline dehydrogenase [Cladophialophora carrionii]